MSLERFHAASTERNGSKPYTCMPSVCAAFATSTPIAPRPITPSFLPRISGPANADFPFSTCFEMSAVPFSVCAHSIAGTIFLDVKSSAASTSSFTALAFAPGVLNTTMPASAHFSTGMLFTPAPALAIASRLLGNSMSCMAAERTKMPSGFSISAAYV